MPDVVLGNQVLAAMITPAILITATSPMVLSASQRLGRIVDRVRALMALAKGLKPEDAALNPEILEDRALIVYQLDAMSRRVVLLQNSLTLLYLGIGLLVASSLGIAASTLVGPGLQWVPVVLALAGAASLLSASLFLVREAWLAVGSTLHELAYTRRVVARYTDRFDGPSI
ncbi:MAG: DUF2721 domain-containing protein [Planctomycetia bacterium]